MYIMCFKKMEVRERKYRSERKREKEKAHDVIGVGSFHEISNVDFGNTKRITMRKLSRE